GYQRAVEVLTMYKDRLVELAERLVAEETIEQEDFEQMFSDIPDRRKDTHITPVPLSGPMTRPEEDEPPARQKAPKPSPQPA
ncbi:MAG TPA: hypothetical protein VNW68_03455, partial [Candidatus Limnocylindria bacterium]|nr:hypothetical protein [Candidatus Limnocylindria bacterium]